MDQIDRIKRMEACLDESSEAIKALSDALEKYCAAQAKYRELVKYYDGGQWRRDFEDDEAGKIPKELKRGVLSEDAVYNLIEENREALETMKKICAEVGR